MWVAPKLTGGLGNRLFQYAAAAGAAEKWDREVVFYSPACQSSPHGPIGAIFRMFPQVRHVESCDLLTEYKEMPRGCYEYIPFNPEPETNLLTSGYRQSYKYFPKEIKPDWDSAIGAEARKKIETLAGLTIDQRKQTYAVHVRLGDFKTLAHHQLDLTKYYGEAFERIPHGSRIHLFSDEPDLCRHLFMDYIAQMNLRFSLAVTSSDVESLYEMSLCLGGTICANSTFSWWGAWFAHQNGAAWATFPSSMGPGLPTPTSYYPEWGTIVPV
jgi:hypothetical protein